MEIIFRAKYLFAATVPTKKQSRNRLPLAFQALGTQYACGSPTGSGLLALTGTQLVSVLKCSVTYINKANYEFFFFKEKGINNWLAELDPGLCKMQGSNVS